MCKEAQKSDGQCVGPPLWSRVKEWKYLNNYWMDFHEIWKVMVPRGWILLTFPPEGQRFHLSKEISEHAWDGLAQNFVQLFTVLMKNPNDFDEPLTATGGFEINALTTIGLIAMKFDTHIHFPLSLNCNNFGDPLTFVTKCLQNEWHSHQPQLCFVFSVNYQMLAC